MCSVMNVIRITNYFLIRSKTCSTQRIQAWYCKPGQKLSGRELVGTMVGTSYC